MCGVAGYINLNGSTAKKSILKKMTDAIEHRGPDGEGFFLYENVAIGHRRLSIIDLSEKGSQPMFSDNKNLVVSYNGEIYNFKEIRKQLISLGHTFYSRTDSEVVLRSWMQWGKKCITKFNGMFAFVVYDRDTKSLFLIRDRYGIKPLYFSKIGDLILFGSEQKAILSHPDFQREIDKEALYEYFTFQNFFTSKTLQKNIEIVEQATVMKVNLVSGQITKEHYWDYDFNEIEKGDPSELRLELDRLLQQAVKRQMVSDVQIGSYLSGGMDSGTLTALASMHLPYINTFTCGFDLSSASGLELAFDEREKAESMSYLFKTEHYEMVLKAGDMERCLHDLAYCLEEPRVGQSYPNYYVAKLASKFVKVVLSGAGGDELFGGYPWRYYRAVKSHNFDEYVDQYYDFWQRLLKQKDKKNVFSPIWNDVKHVDTKEIFKSVFRDLKNKDTSTTQCINNSLYFESKTFLHGLFVIEDKISMAHSLETRVPFMDNDLVDFSMRCPVSLKISNINEITKINENTYGNKQSAIFQKTNEGKQILREVMSKYIPKSITDSEKQGFSSPDSSWFKGDSINYVKDKLLNKNAPIYEYLDFKETTKLINQHLSGKNNRRLLIWSMLNTNEYIDINL